MCLPGQKCDHEHRKASKGSATRTTMLSTIGMGAVMLLACIVGPALIAAAGGALTIGTLGLTGAILAVTLCVAGPLSVRAWQASRGKPRAADDPTAA